MMSDSLMWVVFFCVVITALVIDLGLLKKDRQPLTVRQALTRSFIFFLLAMAFNGFVYYEQGTQAASEFLMGYLIELSLSVDNLFVFLLIFTHFAVPSTIQQRVLLWGILGAILMRGCMIWLGDTLLERFDWLMYIFGAFLVYTGCKMFIAADAEPDVSNNKLIGWMRGHFRMTADFVGEQFFAMQGGKRYVTPLFMVLILIEISDLIFAVDSIPAIFAVTSNGYIIFTSNIFAILGLRSLYFALAAIIHRFEYLKYGLSVVLIFIGGKMLLNHYYVEDPVSTRDSLIVVVLVIGASMLYSLLRTRREDPHQPHTGWVPGSAKKPDSND